MTKAELIERIARSRALPPDITKKDIDKIVTLAFEELAGYFVKARVTRSQVPKFAFPHFGTFVKKRRSARRGVNPRTLEPMNIDAFFTLDFRMSGELRDALNLGKPEAEAASRRRGRAEVEDLDREVAGDEGEAATQLPAPGLQRVRATASGSRARSA
ncbi:MAG: HU family DNA-binding protein [Nannocystaceae bacterium]|nr:HU family DNA-binding protein [Nannocystaceae bacterium]